MAVQTLLLLESLSLASLLAVAAAAWRGGRLVRSPPLSRFLLAFVLMSISQAAALMLGWLTSQAAAIPARSLDHYDLLFWVYHATQVAGWGLVLSTFDRRKFRWVLAVGPVLLVAGPLLELATLAALFLVVLHSGLNHIERSRRGSLQATLGYALILLGHFLFLLDAEPLSPRTPLGEAAALAGLALLAVASRPRAQDPGGE